MGAAIWSCPTSEIQLFPAKQFFDFWHNHCLLSVANRPVWKTVLGGSQSYINQFKVQFSGTVLINSPVSKIRRERNGVCLLVNGVESRFDKVLIATHADQAYALLADPTRNETKLLSAWEYTHNTVYLHRDKSVMPPSKSAWASWCVKRSPANQLNLSYYMNRLQPLDTKLDYFVTLNDASLIDAGKIVETIHYAHPKYTFNSMNTQSHLHELNQSPIFYSGSYFGYGFHEDGITSSLSAIKAMGLNK